MINKDKVIEINDIDVGIDSEHNYKGMRLCLLLSLMAILIVEMIVTYVIMI